MKAPDECLGFFIWNPGFFSFGFGSRRVQHCTWLGFSPCAPSGTGACRRQWRKQAGGASGIARSGQGTRLCEFPGSIQHGEKRPGESCSRAVFSQVRHCTWLGFQPCALSGIGACRRQWRKQAGGASGIAGSDRRSRLCEFPGGRERDGKRPGESCSRAVFSQVQHCTWLGYLLPAVVNLAAVHLPAAADDVLHKGVKIQGNSSFAQPAGCAALLDTASGA